MLMLYTKSLVKLYLENLAALEYALERSIPEWPFFKAGENHPEFGLMGCR